MILDFAKITENLDIEITGNENWLEKIYHSFDCKAASSKATISGIVHIDVENPTYIRLHGRVSFTPKLACSRCSDLIPIELNETIDIFLLKEKPRFLEEQDLTKDELEEYYLGEDKKFDLEIAVNDVLQIARPANPVLKDSNDNCIPCGADLSETLVTNSTTQESSPFAILTELKLEN